MKTMNEIHTSLNNKMESNLHGAIKRGSMLDLFNYSMSDEMEEMYEEIERAKNPHLFTNISGDELDDLGRWTNLTRRDNEDDNTYKYRLKDHEYDAEASNTIAISNALLTPQYARNIDYVPNTHGCGTGTCYIIPTTYEEDAIESALKEAKERIESIVSPSLYVEYIIPTIRAVKLNCFLQTTAGMDINAIKADIEALVLDYINDLAPRQYLKVGDIVRIGLNVTGVEYFNVMALLINEEPSSDLSIVQELETKLMYDEIIWTGER
jgi:uncharacterized phage protein gp47/JayE